ncbi:MAG: BrnA antitoxin family protein [Candidatus Binatus sp.]
MTVLEDQAERAPMKREYDFSKAKRGPVVPSAPGKKRVTIRLDNDIIEHFQDLVDRAGGGNYQTMINAALREHIQGARLETVVRRAVRKEVEAVRDALARTG